MTRYVRATAAAVAALTLTLAGCDGDELPETEDPSLDEPENGDVVPPTTG